MNTKITQSVEIDLEVALTVAIKSMPEEHFAIMISNVMKRAHSPHLSKMFMLEKMKSIHSIG